MRFALALALCLLGMPAHAQFLLQGHWNPAVPPAVVRLDFLRNVGVNGSVGGTAASLLTVTRAQTVNTTDLLPTSPAGYAYQTFAANTPRLTPGLGLLIEPTRTNLLLNSTAPATQTTGSLANGSYVLWVNGTGSAAVTAGTGTGCTGTATQGNPLTLTMSGTAGTCVVTVTPPLSAFQLELSISGVGTSLIVTAAATAVRNADVVTLTTNPMVGVVGAAFTYQYRANFMSASANTQNQVGLQIDDGTNANRTQLIRTLTSNLSSVVNSGGVSGQTSGLQLRQNAYARHAGANAANYQSSTQDATNPAINTAVVYTVPTVFTTFRMGEPQP